MITITFYNSDKLVRLSDEGNNQRNFVKEINMTLCHCQVKNMSEADAEEELLEAFKVLDPEGFGYINSSELRNVLTSLGEKLSDEDLDDMIKEGC